MPTFLGGITDLIIKGACGKTTTVERSDIVEFGLRLSGGEVFMVRANVLGTICHPLSSQPVSLAVKTFPHLHGLSWSDTHSDNVSLPIDILLGADLCYDLFHNRTLHGNSGEPVAISTKLGWVLGGPMTSSVNSHNSMVV